MDLLYTILATMSTLLLIFFLFICFFIFKLLYKKNLFNPNYPPTKGTVFGQLFYFDRFHDYMTDLAKVNRTFRLLTPDQSEIYTTEPRNIEHILKTNFHNYSKGKYNQDIVVDLFGEGIFAVDGERWKHQRKLASYEFSTRVLRDFSCSVFRQNAEKLVTTVWEISERDQGFDIQDLLMKCTLDSIFKVGFGVDLNCLEGASKRSREFSKAFDDSNFLVYRRYADPFWKIKRYLNFGSEASIKKNIKVIDNFIFELIREKKKLYEERHRDINGKEDILSRFLDESAKNPEKMHEQYLRDIILNFMIAGKDTTAVTLSWFIYVLCKHPLVQEKIFQEIRKVMNVEDDDECQVGDFIANLTDSTLGKLQYLHAALTETLRLYPAVPVDGKVAEIDGTLPDGYKLKRGDGVYYLAYTMGRMPQIWGEDAEDYKPERWLDKGIFQPESPFKFVAFHAGPRICLGKDFAYRQMKIASTALLRYFRFRLVDDTTSVTYRTMFTLHIDGGLHVSTSLRAGKPSQYS